MSKKKGKPAARKAPKKAATSVAKSAARKASARPGVRTSGSESGRSLTVTIFLYRTSHGNKIRTSPQKLYANPGDRVNWNVVNLIDGTDVPVTITWPEEGPWGKEPIQIRSWERKSLTGARSTGNFKYVVSALDAQEDPEIELPDGN